MKKTVAAFAASGILMGGALATAAVSTPSAALAQEATEGSTEVRPERGALLTEVLSGLVGEDVITQAQADEIKEALETRFQEVKDERGKRRHGPGNIRGLLEDGVIDSDELALLGEDHRLNDPDGPAAQYLEDGALTKDELLEIRQQLRGQEVKDERGKRRHGPGNIRGLLEDGVIHSDELALLGEDHRLNDPDGPAAQYLEDGALTKDELLEIRQQLRGERGGVDSEEAAA